MVEIGWFSSIDAYFCGEQLVWSLNYFSMATMGYLLLVFSLIVVSATPVHADGIKSSSPQTPAMVVSNRGNNCHPAYPGLCLPANGTDINCKDIRAKNFRVLPPDPYGLDRDLDGIGCEKRQK